MLPSCDENHPNATFSGSGEDLLPSVSPTDGGRRVEDVWPLVRLPALWSQALASPSLLQGGPILVTVREARVIPDSCKFLAPWI